MWAATVLLGALSLLGKVSAITSSEYAFDGELEDVRWVGKDQKSVLVLTESGQVYRSADEGKTWSAQNARLEQIARSGLASPGYLPGDQKAPTPQVIIGELHVSERDPNFVFLLGNGKASFSSINGGASWSLAGAPDDLPLERVVLHPHDSSSVLGSTKSLACYNGAQSSDKERCSQALYLSKDLGKNWVFVQNYVEHFDWIRPEVRGAKYPQGFPASDAILATVHRNKILDQMFGVWNAGLDLVRTFDAFNTQEVLVSGGNQFVYTDRFVFAAQVLKGASSSGGATDVHLMVSARGVELSFTRSHLPLDIRKHSYNILDTSEGAAFVHVNHHGDRSRFGHVYLSDATGTNFSLSLPNNARDENGNADFEAVYGLEGVYLANMVSNTQQIEEYAQAAGGGMGQELRKRAGRAPDVKIRTLVSFDKGGRWQYLKPPASDSHGAPLTCNAAEHCSLHLHGTGSRNYGGMYSVESSTGLIIATGTVGTNLRYERSEIVNTFLSNDGGLTWSEVKKGSRIYEIGDHGGLIVMADNRNPTGSVEYSRDFGRTWENYAFSATPMSVSNIVIEPTSKGNKFIVYGTRPSNRFIDVFRSTPSPTTPPPTIAYAYKPPSVGSSDAQEKMTDEGVLYAIDFSEGAPPPCQGFESAGTDASDFELWTASDGRLGGKCLLGRRVTYTRRRADRVCTVGEGHTKRVEADHCPCAESDYECDFGYMRAELGDNSEVLGGACVKDPNVAELLTEVDQAWQEHMCAVAGAYTVSIGYRKVANDSCVVEGGLNRLPVARKCSGGSFIATSTRVVFSVIWWVLVACGVLSCAACVVGRFRPGLLHSLGRLGPCCPTGANGPSFGTPGEGIGTRHFSATSASSALGSFFSGILSVLRPSRPAGPYGSVSQDRLGQVGYVPESAMDYTDDDVEQGQRYVSRSNRAAEDDIWDDEEEEDAVELRPVATPAKPLAKLSDGVGGAVPSLTPPTTD